MRSSMKNKTKLRRRSFLPQFMTCIGGLCMAKAQYNADSITVLEGLEAVQASRNVHRRRWNKGLKPFDI